MNDYNSNKAEGPWNPGVVSELPRHYLPLSTMFRPENVAISMAKAQELSDFCGLPDHTLVAFRADRLIVHELLIRVTADIAVPDGSRYADLGINFREIASTIHDQYIAPIEISWLPSWTISAVTQGTGSGRNSMKEYSDRRADHWSRKKIGRFYRGSCLQDNIRRHRKSHRKTRPRRQSCTGRENPRQLETTRSSVPVATP